MKPIEIACSHTDKNGMNCLGQAGCLCTEFGGDHYALIHYFHAERVADAAAINVGTGDTPTKEEFDEAIKGLDI